MALHPPAEDEETASGKTPSIVTHGTEEDLGFHPTVQELMKAIISDPEINVFFNQIFWQQYKLPGFSKGTNIPSWQLMIILIDHIMTSAPESLWFGCRPHQRNPKLANGYDCWICRFPQRQSQHVVQSILNYWGKGKVSFQFCLLLRVEWRSSSWLVWWRRNASNAKLRQRVQMQAQRKTSWFYIMDDFFNREFRGGIRPVASPDDNSIVANACESAPYQISTAVKNRDFFWMKYQRYSLDFILNMSDLAKKFYGGTVYQAYLSATSYHWWHSPVSGTI